MTEPGQKQISPPEVPDEGPSDPAKRRRQNVWMVLICVLLIIVALALIVNELAR